MLHSQVRTSELHHSASSTLSFFCRTSQYSKNQISIPSTGSWSLSQRKWPYITIHCLYFLATQFSMYNYVYRIIAMCHSENIFISWFNREFNRDIWCLNHAQPPIFMAQSSCFLLKSWWIPRFPRRNHVKSSSVWRQNPKFEGVHPNCSCFNQG